MNLKTEQTNPHVLLTDCTKNIGKKIKEITSVCRNKNIKKTNEEIFNMLNENKHTSVFEHIYFTFKISNISRVCSHQLVRYRVGIVFTQQSQRSVEPDKYLFPTSIIDNKEIYEEAKDLMYKTNTLYYKMLDNKIKKEDARYILPSATETNMMMTINARELIVAGQQRLCSHAQKEIRDLFKEVQKAVALQFEPIAKAMNPNCSLCASKCCCKSKCS